MSEQDCQKTSKSKSRDEHVDKCLSMIMHFDEVQLIASVIKEIIIEQEQAEQSGEDI